MYGGKQSPDKDDFCSDELWFYNIETLNWF